MTCPKLNMPRIDGNRPAVAMRLQRTSDLAGPAIVYLQDPVASTFVVVFRDPQGCPSIYVGGRWSTFSQREYLSPFPNTRLPEIPSGTEIQVVIQDERVLRPFVQLSSESDFRQENLLVWMMLAALVAVLIMVIVMMNGFVGRNRIVTAYVIYVASFLWWIVQEFGMAAAWFPGLFPPSSFVVIQCVSVAIVILGIGWTIVEFLALKGVARALIGGGQILSACTFVAAIAWPQGYQAGSLILGLNAVPTMVLLLRHLRHSDLPVKLFAIGFTATMVGGGAQSLSVAFAGSASNPFAVYAFAMGGFVQVMFWMLAITTRLKRERSQLIQWRSEELEHQVTEATAELMLKKQVAEDATRAKSDFLAAASHDLRQPTHALGMLIARLGQFPMEPGMHQVQRSLEASVYAMQDLLDELMDFSRLDSNTEKIELRPVALDQILIHLRDTLTPLAASKGLRLRIRPTTLCVLSEPIMLRRMIMNLALNAIRYTPHGTLLIAFRPTRDGRQIKIEVWDSGVGIAQEHHVPIFKEFYQIGNAARDRHKGIGLGLSIVQRSAQLLGHTIALRSQLGCGSRFTILLSKALVTLPAPVSKKAETLDPANISGLNVLLVEDDDLSRNAVEALLVSWGCRVLAASSGVQARELIQINPLPDIIVSDYRLGELENGITVVAELRAIAGRQIPACLISGDMDSELMIQIKSHDMSLLHKPVRPAKLRSLIRHLMAPV